MLGPTLTLPLAGEGELRGWKTTGSPLKDQVILAWLQAEPVLPEVICLKRPDGRLVILEGHTRATAIALEAHRFKKGVSIYIGEGPSVSNWAYL
ncbi:MAG: hypothetical protein NVS1B3_02140 [Candidatus Dormibacteraceae bacterium]